MVKEEQLRTEIIQRLAQKKVVGGHKKQIDTVKSWFATSDQGTAEELIRSMIRDPDAPLEAYGGSRDNVRLTSLSAAKEFITRNGGDLPWGLRDD